MRGEWPVAGGVERGLMRGRLLVIAGTGTSIGKTHVGEALLRGAAKRARVAGWKPIESGVDEGILSDGDRLAGASSFHVKHLPRYALRAPISPHLAARREGVVIQVEPIVQAAIPAAQHVEGLLVELAGGLFSPIGEHALNVDLATALVPDMVLLVAPDRLGVLHDVVAAIRALGPTPLSVDGIVLVAPPVPDASTGLNAAELPLVSGVPVLASVPRGTPEELAGSSAIDALVRLWLPSAA